MAIKQLWDKYKQVVAYLFWGVVTTIINIASYQWFSTGLHWNYEVATAVAWFLSVLAAFFTNKVWVFGSHYTTWQAFWRELISFFFYRGVTLLMDMAMMWLALSVLGMRSPIQQLIAKTLDNVVVVIANYIFSKWLIFKSNDKIPDEKSDQ